jgi:hypothetical protein
VPSTVSCTSGETADGALVSVPVAALISQPVISEHNNKATKKITLARALVLLFIPNTPLTGWNKGSFTRFSIAI